MSDAPAATAGAGGGELLAPDVLARLERLQLRTRRPLAGRFAGEHRSRRDGTSLDFADYRQYHPGDDFRRIDYQLWARLDVLLCKLFEAEEDLSLRLLIDTSASMAGPKLHQAARVAAALGFVGLVRRDAVTVHTFPHVDAGTAHGAAGLPARFVGRAAAPRLFAHLEAMTAGGETRFAQAVAHLLGRPGPPGVTVVISDLLTPEWSRAISRLPARGAELVVVQVLDDAEVRPSMVGDLELVDRETGDTVAVSLTPEARRDYERAVGAWLDEVAGRVREVGGAYLRVLVGDDIEALLLAAWQREGVLR